MRVDQLTSTRFLAAISIVIYHDGQNIYPFCLEIMNFLFKKANIGVSYFFILSGFVMILAYGKRGEISFGDYIQKRLARLYPAYLLAIVILLFFFIIKTFITLEFNIDFIGLLLNLTLLQSWVPGKVLSFNTPGWSLSTEMFFYLSFPLLMNNFYRKVSFKSASIFVFLVFLITQIGFNFSLNSSFYKGYPSISHDVLHYLPIMHINEFLIGNVAGLFFIKKGLKNKNYDFIIIFLILIISVLLKLNLRVSYHNGLLAVLFVPLIIFICLNKGFITKFLTKKPFVFLGEISYGIYIYQYPIQLLVYGILETEYFKWINNSEIEFFTYVITLIIFSALSYIYIEIPLRERINKIKFKSR